ncbi:ExbD/TolR family protein [Shimia biformata]|uniref:ExbD/TolR family protein n=1 Tax=Shimia biformata TaxID=1294299 RepID=UPI001951DA02|nr:biopolymer transporter ExbD [Shimia biformata]
MFNLVQDRPRRRPSLTPMIDVVFLLLVFFMLASRFGAEQVLPVPLAGNGGAYQGPPRLIEVSPATVKLNGVEVALAELPAYVADLMSAPQDMLILRGREGATLQRIVDVSDALRGAGMTNLVLVE